MRLLYIVIMVIVALGVIGATVGIVLSGNDDSDNRLSYNDIVELKVLNDTKSIGADDVSASRMNLSVKENTFVTRARFRITKIDDLINTPEFSFFQLVCVGGVTDNRRRDFPFQNNNAYPVVVDADTKTLTLQESSSSESVITVFRSAGGLPIANTSGRLEVGSVSTGTTGTVDSSGITFSTVGLSTETLSTSETGESSTLEVVWLKRQAFQFTYGQRIKLKVDPFEVPTTDNLKPTKTIVGFMANGVSNKSDYAFPILPGEDTFVTDSELIFRVDDWGDLVEDGTFRFKLTCLGCQKSRTNTNSGLSEFPNLTNNLPLMLDDIDNEDQPNLRRWFLQPRTDYVRDRDETEIVFTCAVNGRSDVKNPFVVNTNNISLFHNTLRFDVPGTTDTSIYRIDSRFLNNAEANPRNITFNSVVLET